MSINKTERKYKRILRNLAKSDSSLFNKLKVSVCKGEFNEEKQCFLIAPLILFNSDKDLENQNLNKISNEKLIENSTEQSDVSFENKNESLDEYPDSSDFSDDE